jgi:hypothetical protein
MRRLALSLGLTVALVAVSAAGAADEGYKPPPKRVSPADGMVAQLKPRGETPKMADGHADLTGMWGGGPADAPYPASGARGLEFFEPDQAVLQRGTAWNKPLYKPGLWEKVYGTDYGLVVGDPTFHCLPSGVPRQNMPVKIIQTPKEAVFRYGNGSVRFIPTDGRKRDPGDDDYELFQGWGLGHWDGETLVVETTGFNNQTWFLWTGYIHSNRMKVTERFTRKGDVLYYQFTVDDPQMLMQPWVSDTYVRRASRDPLARVEEYLPCVENDEKNLADPYFRG